MNKQPRQVLRQVLAKYGKDICSDAARCRGLLNDLCGPYRREINVLTIAIENHVPLDLLAAAKSVPAEMLLTRLEKRLQDQTGLTSEAARWAVESWALALGIATDLEIEQRGLQPINRANTQTITSASAETGNDLPNTNASGSNQNARGRQPKTVPSLPPQVPPAANPPLTRTNPAPASKHLPPVNPPRPQSGATGSPTASSPGKNVLSGPSRFLRGCLVVFFLMAISAAVLLFGIPYAVEVMRETQRPNNNEKPRFPVR
jgi:hypothetical protein